MAIARHITRGLPVETLNEIHDMLTLALDVTERAHSHHMYPQGLREARAYMRTARRATERLMEVAR